MGHFMLTLYQSCWNFMWIILYFLHLVMISIYDPSVGPPSYIVHERYCKTTPLLNMRAVNWKFVKRGFFLLSQDNFFQLSLGLHYWPIHKYGSLPPCNSFRTENLTEVFSNVSYPHFKVNFVLLFLNIIILIL